MVEAAGKDPPKRDAIQTLRSGFLFRSLSDSELEELAGLSLPRRIDRNKTIFEKGEEGDFAVAVISGRVRIVSYSEDGKEVILNLIEAGEIFGEIAAIDGATRTAHAIADAASDLLFLPRARLLAFLEARPKVAIRLLQVLCSRLRDTSATVETLAFHGLEARLATLLLRIADRYGRDGEGGLVLEIKLSQKDLGNLIATSRESVSKQLARWQESGLVDMSAGRLVLKDVEALETIAGQSEA